MTTTKSYTLATFTTAFVIACAVLIGGGVAHAQTVYTGSNGVMYSVPAGFNSYTNGVYYNSGNGVYFNPVTGQYSFTAPSGAASRDGNGNYIIPSGYSTSMYGTYYNPSTGMYYDPVTGFYSTSAPLGPNATGGDQPGSGTVGLPNTGAGGEAPLNVALLSVGALAALAGTWIVAHKKTYFAH